LASASRHSAQFRERHAVGDAPASAAPDVRPDLARQDRSRLCRDLAQRTERARRLLPVPAACRDERRQRGHRRRAVNAHCAERADQVLVEPDAEECRRHGGRWKAGEPVGGRTATRGPVQRIDEPRDVTSSGEHLAVGPFVVGFDLKAVQQLDHGDHRLPQPRQRLHGRPAKGRIGQSERKRLPRREGRRSECGEDPRRHPPSLRRE
jgi:hypothetical protein